MIAKILVIILLWIFAGVGGHAAGYWEDVTDRPVVCSENRTGCQILQMVMMGSFDDFDPSDSLCRRVLSAALPKLRAVTDDDAAHFLDEFNIDAAVLERCYYIALGNCLWADFLVAPEPEDTLAADMRRVLLLFLDPAGESNAREQIAIIRSRMTDELIARISGTMDVPESFVKYLVFEDDWRSASPGEENAAKDASSANAPASDGSLIWTIPRN